MKRHAGSWQKRRGILGEYLFIFLKCIMYAAKQKYYPHYYHINKKCILQKFKKSIHTRLKKSAEKGSSILP
jgi:hypothetical protein